MYHTTLSYLKPNPETFLVYFRGTANLTESFDKYKKCESPDKLRYNTAMDNRCALEISKNDVFITQNDDVLRTYVTLSHYF
jgi:hypothetical protein